ncbi:MAG: MoxR family ATPase [Abditibacteriales bacterium]|nr:MoxR family ATPase [Abditibacteriales bacterium]MDW8368107.1 MoxR family ATPase [Abditibacteriales bacterium]
MDNLLKQLLRLAEENLNVLLIGRHGVGKTSMVKSVAQQLQLAMKYYSASTLDPWADLVGIPVPADGQGLIFHRPRDVDNAELIFFDELNRSHPKVQNACFELIQFKSINGEPLPKLRMVWAAINPPASDYDVTELDPALADRFHAHVQFPYRPSLEYFQSVFPADVARILVTWWNDELSEQQKAAISPRRLEYIGTLHVRGLPPELGIPTDASVPVTALTKMLNRESLLNIEDFVNNPRAYRHIVASDLNIATRFLHVLKAMTDEELCAVRSLVLELPPDLLGRLKRDMKPVYDKLLRAIAQQTQPREAQNFQRELEARLNAS